MCNAQMIRNQLCCARQEEKEYMEKVSFVTFFGSWLVFQGPLHNLLQITEILLLTFLFLQDAVSSKEDALRF